MRWSIIFLMLAFAVLLISGCSTRYSSEQMSACRANDDCIVVEGKGCCGCDTAINRQFKDYWMNLENDSCPGRECEACPPMPTGARCINNACRPDYPGMG